MKLTDIMMFGEAIGGGGNSGGGNGCTSLPLIVDGAAMYFPHPSCLESIEKIASALNVSLSKLFEHLGGQDAGGRNIPLECYEFLSAKTPEDQEQLFNILREMDKYKTK